MTEAAAAASERQSEPERTFTVRTEALGGGPLARAMLAGDARVAAWYAPRPLGSDDWRARSDAARARFAGAAWLAQLAPAFGTTLDATPAGARLTSAAGRGVVVTTGQQPGLFGGPMYTWSKALAALELADALERQLGIPVAPVFWAATDDADFAEAAVTHVAVTGGLDTLRMNASALSATPMAHVPSGDVSTLLERLARGAGSAAHANALQIARSAYAGEATVGSAYLALLRAMLEPLGVAVLDASHDAVTTAADALLRRALRDASTLATALDARAATIEAAGFAPQVTDLPALTLVFESATRGAKARISLATAAEAIERAAVGTLGPNVLLRPVVEQAILPTVAYVAGPGELQYFAQVSAVASTLGEPLPLAVPRWSGTVVESHVQRILARLEITEAELTDPHAVESRLVRARFSTTSRAALESLRASVRTSLAALRAEHALPDAAVDGAANQLGHRVDRLERRLLAATKRREMQLMRDVATARAALAPLGGRQERVLNMLPLLARHGPALIDAMRQAARAHVALVVAGTYDTVPR